MGTESETTSGWFTQNSGKFYGRCPACHSPRISYYKIRRTGLKGISSASTGLTPFCIDCGKNLPRETQHTKKPTTKKVISHHA